MIDLHQNEEKRLRSVLAGYPTTHVRVQAEFDLERLLRTKNAQSDELTRLEADS
jgi:hypothetical protein